MAEKEKKAKYSPLTIVLLVVLCLYVLSMALLFFWGILTSLKNYRFDILGMDNTYGFPKYFANNFATIYQGIRMPVTGGDVDFGRLLSNSLMYSIGCAFLKTLTPCITAYACARFDFKSSKVVYTLVLIAMIIPIAGSLPSELKIAYGLGFYDKMWGVWLMSANMLGMYFFVMYSAFKAMPMGYTEAAKIDGANNFQVLTTIALPLVKNLFMTILLINFVEYWNNYQTPQVYLPNHPTLGYTLYYFVRVSNDKTFSTLPSVISLAIIVVIPVLVLFLVFQERLMGNLTMGGLKG